MSKSLTSLDRVVEPRNLRRRLLPLASSAALGLTGCMGAQHAPAVTADVTAQQEAIQRVQKFTSGIDTAVDKADPARLKMSAALNGSVSDGSGAKPQVVLASNQNDVGVAPASATAPAGIAKMSSAPIATLTAVNQGVSGVPSSLGTMTAMGGSAQDRVPVVPKVAPDVARSGEVGSAASGSSIVATTQPGVASGGAGVTPSASREKASSVEGTMKDVSASSGALIGTSGATTAPALVAAIAPPPPTPLPPRVAMPVVAAVPAEPTVDVALNVLRKQVLAHPTLNGALALALLDSAQGHVPDPGAAAALSAPDQKLFADLLAALEGMTTPISASTTLADRATPLVDAAKKWQADADLTLPKLALASRVDSFGVYTPVEAKFPQGVKRTVIIYCEVADFACKKTDDGWYETHLSQQDTLITEDGLLIWRPTAEEVEDRSMNQRRDFYLVKKLTIPDTLAAGKYTLRMSVTDRTANKLAMKNIPIEITEK